MLGVCPSQLPTSVTSRASQQADNDSLFVLEFGGLRGVNSLNGVAPDKVRACPWPCPLGPVGVALFWPATAGAAAVLLRVLISDNGRLFCVCRRQKERKREGGAAATGWSSPLTISLFVDKKGDCRDQGVVTQ